MLSKSPFWKPQKKVIKLDTKKCPSCGKEIPTSANFCTHCGKKLNAVCDCWVKEKPYNCGLDKCPGIRLFLIEKRAREKPYHVYEFNELGNRHSATVSFEMAYHDWLKLENSAAFREMVDYLRKIQTTGGE